MTATIPTQTRGLRWQAEAVVSEDIPVPAQMARVFDYVKGLHATHLMDLGTRLGLFEDLARRSAGASPLELASSLGLRAPYVQIWCETACALELLDYEPGTGYRLAPGVAEVLGNPAASFYIGSFPEAHLEVARDYARYQELFRDGGTNPYAAHDESFLRAVAAATRVLPRMFMDGVLPQLPELQDGLRAGARVLDIGCGAGHAMVQLAQRFNRVNCVGVDADEVSVAMARQLVRDNDLDQRIGVRMLDATALPDDLVSSADLVTMFLVLHEIAPGAKARLLSECRRALRDGGKLLIFDERYPSGPAELRDPTQIYAVMAQWYEATWGNVIDDREGIQALLADAGFQIEQEAELSRFYIVVAGVA